MMRIAATTDYGLRTTDSRRKGFVLLVVLVVLVMLSLAAYKFTGYMTKEYQSSQSQLKATQSRALAESGIHYAAALLSNPDTLNKTLNGNPYNSSMFGNQGSEESGPGKFSLLAPSDTYDSHHFGVINENGKININMLLKLYGDDDTCKKILMILPNMTDELADSILYWLDPADLQREHGAGRQDYESQSPSYKPRNGPIDSLEELLLVKGVTAQLLFGNDRNRNGIIDANEDDGSDKIKQLGWSAYLTVYSRELDVDSKGKKRVYLNETDTDQLKTDLQTALENEDLVNFIMAYRQNGPAQSSGGQGGGRGTRGTRGVRGVRISRGDRGTRSDRGTRGTRGQAGGGGGGRGSNISSFYDLIDSKVTISSTSGRTTTQQTMDSPLSTKNTDFLKQWLPVLMDKTTTIKPGDAITPRININTAPTAVLEVFTQIVQGFTDADVQAIIANRPNPSNSSTIDPIYQTPAWLITQANLKPATVKALEKYFTTKAQVFRVQSVGFFPKGGPATRIEAVIDTNAGKPRIIYWRDLTELGLGMDRSLVSSP